MSMMSSMRESVPPDVAGAIADLLRGVDSAAAVSSIAPASAGGNNRVFRVETSAGRFLAKQYFAHSGDRRDRLSSEFLFMAYACQVAPGLSPRPYARDSAANIALYEYVEGRPFGAGEIKVADVDQAAAFFRALNAPDSQPHALGLPLASEAAFSISGHLALIDRRIRNLMGIEADSEEDRPAAALVARLHDEWSALRDKLLRLGADWELDAHADIAESQRCVSPSDFGFHNALQRPDGRVCFLDFEYAGWDDPARMMGDFFAQLAVPVPASYFGEFAHRCLGGFPGSEALRRRALILRPAYLAKWCCIAMGVFLPVSMARRKFANPGLDEAAAKHRQLDKAESILQMMRIVSHGLH
jgi:Phosphotransferase enzyme family